VKLLDFGVSKLIDDAPGNAHITGTGAPIGTPLYMSPEQAEGKHDVDGRADIWSLGAVMYEAFAGVVPFPDRGSYHGTIVGILTSRPKLLLDAAPWVPPEVAAVIDAMLVHDRDARLQTADTVTQRLLDAFPTVLPDGTGKHTAVIVAQAAAAIDATGDTEVFSSRGSIPSVRAGRPVTGPGRPEKQGEEVKGQDFIRTAPDLDATIDSTRPPESSHDPRRTGTATPIAMSSDYRQGFTGPHDPRAAQTGPPWPRRPAVTERLASWNRNPSATSSGGVVMPTTPATPAGIDPLPRPDETAPTPAPRRRRRVTILTWVALVIVSVAAGAWFAGWHHRRNAPLPKPMTVTTTSATPTAAPSASGARPPAEVGSPTTPAPSTIPLTPSAARPRKLRPRVVTKPDSLTPSDESRPLPAPTSPTE
jgi:hypothetical protein